MKAKPHICVVAGGTGGHIFPGIACAEAFAKEGWQVSWVGGSGQTMEARLVPEHGIAFSGIVFSGVRGKGWMAWLLLPLRLIWALLQSLGLLLGKRCDVVLGMGGYVTVPMGIAAFLLRRPLVIHEQNAIAGSANRLLSHLAKRSLSSFPRVFGKGQCVGHPLRDIFVRQAMPEERFVGRQGPIRLLVVGGSLGAKALNELVPKALALLAPEERPLVTHQSGEQHIEALKANYAAAQVTADVVPFIRDMASSLADADVVICRAGASTVAEVTAVGVAALFVPFPFAVDDHQTYNAQALVEANAAWCIAQADLSAEKLVNWVNALNRTILLKKAEAARKVYRGQATYAIVRICQEFVCVTQ